MTIKFCQRLVFALLLTALFAVSSGAQIKGLSKKKFPALGYSLKVPKRWDQIPPQPNEDETMAKWALDTASKGTGEAYALRVMRFRPRSGVTGGATKQDGEAPAGMGDGVIPSPEDMMKEWRERNRPISFKDYWKKRFGGFPGMELAEPTDLKIGKLKGKLYELVGKSSFRGNDTSTIVGTVSDGTYEWAIIYSAPTKELFPEKSPKQSTKVKSRIKSSIKSLKFFDAVRKSQPKGVDRDNMSEMDKTIEEVKRKLPPNWKVLPTPRKQYVIVHNIPQKKTRQIAFAHNIVKYLERIRKYYEKVFPPRKQITKVSVVRVCQDKEEYHQYGGPGGSAGYFNPGSGELVIYDASKDGGTADSYSVLFHEAYHQYLYYAVGQVSAHSWFNEGYGDYFSGSNPKKGFKIGVFDWRTGTVKKAVSEKKNVHLKDLFYYTQRQYYANPSVCYAQGWALVYFLKSKSAKKNERWPQILDIYFNTLVKTRDKGKAVKAALDGVDIEKLNKAYMTFIKKGFK